jgi:hypothetical protein
MWSRWATTVRRRDTTCRSAIFAHPWFKHETSGTIAYVPSHCIGSAQLGCNHCADVTLGCYAEDFPVHAIERRGGCAAE